jgi:dTDP-4-amino-4,6-dideoxygalactose transaminase
MTLSDRARHAAAAVAVESYAVVGYNYRLTDIQAAIGREQLARLPEALDRRRALAARYTEQLTGVPGLVLPIEPVWGRSNVQSYCVRLPDACDQRQVMQQLLDEGISTRRGVMCAHREPAYAHEPWTCVPNTVRCPCGVGGCQRLRESEGAQDRSIILPLYHTLADDDQQRVVAALRRACLASRATV